MKISELEKLILDNTSKFNLNKGKQILEGSNLPKINIKKAEDNYNIYGNFNSENKLQSCNSHLKIDIINKIITLAKCQCSGFLEFDSKNNVYLCEHLVALGLNFIYQIKKKMNKITEDKEVLKKDKNLLLNLPNANNFISRDKIDLDKLNLSLNTKKQKLQLSLSLKEVLEYNRKCFGVSIFIGSNTMYPIGNIEGFILSLNNSKEYYIGKGLIYNKDNYYFSKEDQEILEYLHEYILISKDNNRGNNIRLDKEIIGRFLTILSNKKIKFNYNYQTYICEIKNEDLPLSFTLKQIKENYVLTTKKVFPIPLNDKMDVFFFDRKIYIPSFIQINLYRLFYNILKEDSNIIFHKDIYIEELYNLISCIKIISKDLTID
ncbi:SNF2 helicase associated domain-containing protein, partial [Clostridium puniceum]|uniref:SNF2 helicase associated domain-containing protein n=1 Tax=Clostridium puniceum TaxID=29367 RepID=UPI0018E974AE